MIPFVIIAIGVFLLMKSGSNDTPVSTALNRPAFQKPKHQIRRPPPTLPKPTAQDNEPEITKMAKLFALGKTRWATFIDTHGVIVPDQFFNGSAEDVAKFFFQAKLAPGQILWLWDRTRSTIQPVDSRSGAVV